MDPTWPSILTIFPIFCTILTALAFRIRYARQRRRRPMSDEATSTSSLHFHSIRRGRNGTLPCENCFPSAAVTEASNPHSWGVESRYVDVLDFPKFGGFPNLSKLESYDTSELRFPWFADIFYTWRFGLNHNYTPVHDMVLKSRLVANTVEKISKENKTPIKHVQAMAVSCLYKMRAKFNKAICRVCGYILFKVFRRVMRRLLVNPAQMVKLKEAEATGIPIVYLPLHRTHLDYLLITWVAWHFGLRLPHIASGDNLNLSGFGWLLRATGAFFIHRRLDPSDTTNKNEVYRSVLNSYMTEILRAGMSLEFFLEGTRSRFGKTLLPKNGLISNIVTAYEEGIIQDVYVVPVSYSYDNIVEGIFHEELMGIRKEKESVMGVIRGVFKGFGRRGKCGNVTIDFGHPCRLSDYLTSLHGALTDNRDHFSLQYAINENSYRELLPWHDVNTPHRSLIRAVGFHVTYEAHQQKPITVSSAVALLLLCHHRKRVRVLQFIRDLSFLCNDMEALGYEVVGWDDQVEPDRAFEEAIVHLRHNLTFSRDHADTGIEGLYIQVPPSHHSIIDLCYRKNGALAPFALLSVVAMTLTSSKICSDLCSGEGSEFPIDDLVENSLTLCNLLQTEIIFCLPCENLRQNIANIVNDLVKDIRACQFKGQTLSFPLTFYANVLRQYVQTLYIVLEYFLQTPRPDSKSFKRDIDFIRRFLLEKSRNRDPTMFAEAYNSDSVYNSIKLLRQKAVLQPERLEIRDEGHAKHILKLIEPFVREYTEVPSPPRKSR